MLTPQNALYPIAFVSSCGTCFQARVVITSRLFAAASPEDTEMFIAMNKFQVKKGCEHDFEHVWLSRDTYLDAVPGFIEFHLLKGRSVRITYSTPRTQSWRSYQDFEAWTKSEQFWKAHAGAGGNKPLYLGRSLTRIRRISRPADGHQRRYQARRC